MKDVCELLEAFDRNPKVEYSAHDNGMIILKWHHDLGISNPLHTYRLPDAEVVLFDMVVEEVKYRSDSGQANVLNSTLVDALEYLSGEFKFIVTGLMSIIYK